MHNFFHDSIPQAPCVFDLRTDPCERRNLYGTPLLSASALATLEGRLEQHRRTVREPNNVFTDLRANPALWNNTWTNWADLLDRAALLGLPLVPEPRQQLSRWG